METGIAISEHLVWPESPPTADPGWAASGFSAKAVGEPAAWAMVSHWRQSLAPVLACAGRFYYEIVPTIRLRTDASTGPRKVIIYKHLVDRFLEARPDSPPPPPPFVYWCNGKMRLYDGNHRLAAWRLAKIRSIAVVVLAGEAEARHATEAFIHAFAFRTPGAPGPS